MTSISRRTFVRSLPALLVSPKLLAQAGPRSLRIRALNHVTLTVSDLQRSIDFYQGLFGTPVQGRQGSTTAALQIGSGPQHLGLTTNATSGNRTPKIDHMCVGIDDFNLDRVVQVLGEHGIARSDQRGAMRVHVRMRGPDAGGATEGTPEVYLGDPDGITLQLQDPTYCRGSGPLGNVCSRPEPASKKGLLALKGYSHCTVFVTDAQRSNAFYQQLFGMPIRSYQGPTAPTLAVGPGVEFLMFAGGGAAPRATGINHFCMTVDKFESNQIVKTLESYGIKPRESQAGLVGPMRHYISMRMENRGGASEGTPELYFTDPDGILVQLQDVSYCGGSGVLGNVCPPV
jgi:catechol 2,3-dioxygenase-like lactoylglutathione lyase family enzyme